MLWLSQGLSTRIPRQTYPRQGHPSPLLSIQTATHHLMLSPRNLVVFTSLPPMHQPHQPPTPQQRRSRAKSQDPSLQTQMNQRKRGSRVHHAQRRILMRRRNRESGRRPKQCQVSKTPQSQHHSSQRAGKSKLSPLNDALESVRHHANQRNSTARQPKITDLVGSFQTPQPPTAPPPSSTAATPTQQGTIVAAAASPALTHLNAGAPSTPRPASSGQVYDPIRSANVEVRPPLNAKMGPVSPQTKLVNRASASPSITSLIDPQPLRQGKPLHEGLTHAQDAWKHDLKSSAKHP